MCLNPLHRSQTSFVSPADVEPPVASAPIVLPPPVVQAPWYSNLTRWIPNYLYGSTGQVVRGRHSLTSFRAVRN